MQACVLQHWPPVDVRKRKIVDLEDEREGIEPDFTDLSDAVVGLRDVAANLGLDETWYEQEADGRIERYCADDGGPEYPTGENTRHVLHGSPQGVTRTAAGRNRTLVPSGLPLTTPRATG